MSVTYHIGQCQVCGKHIRTGQASAEHCKVCGGLFHMRHGTVYLCNNCYSRLPPEIVQRVDPVKADFAALQKKNKMALLIVVLVVFLGFGVVGTIVMLAMGYGNSSYMMFVVGIAGSIVYVVCTACFQGIFMAKKYWNFEVRMNEALGKK
nr:hypothetical protein [Candidatus Sigynarchaeota archaeon]